MMIGVDMQGKDLARDELHPMLLSLVRAWRSKCGNQRANVVLVRFINLDAHGIELRAAERDGGVPVEIDSLCVLIERELGWSK